MMIRARWASLRPYAGHADDSLQRKIQCDAVEKWAKVHARRELDRRVQIGGTARFMAATKGLPSRQG
jgi:hypothetical protein